MTRYIIGDLRTGRQIEKLPVMTGPWDDRLDTAETITVKVDLQDPDVRNLGLRNASTLAKSYLGVVEGDVIVACGPIWTFTYDRDAATIDLGAAGLGSYYDHRLILPLLAASIGVDQWTIPDPSDSTRTIPNPALTSSYTGLWLGTIAKRLVQQAHTWTGGNLPVVFQADEADGDADHERNYLGADFKPVGEAIQDLSNVEDGPETNFQPRFTTDRLGVEWVMQVGTVAQPLLFSPQRPQWNLTVPQSPVSKFTIDGDASKMGSWSWQTGGRQSDDVLVARAYDPALVDAGFPLMDVLDTSHTSVSKQSTLDGYAKAGALLGKQLTETWSFTVEAFPTDEEGNPAGPQLTAWNVGDFCDLTVAKYDEETGAGDPYLTEGGKFPLRIIGRSGDEKGTTVKVQCAPILV